MSQRLLQWRKRKRPAVFGHNYGRRPRGAGFPHGNTCHYCGGKVLYASSARGQAVVICHGNCGKKHPGYMFAICETCSDALWKSEEATQ